jgi:hypothetical protein
VGNEKRERREERKAETEREEKRREREILKFQKLKKKIRLCKIWGQKKKINKKNFFIKNRRQDMEWTGQDRL